MGLEEEEKAEHSHLPVPCTWQVEKWALSGKWHPDFERVGVQDLQLGLHDLPSVPASLADVRTCERDDLLLAHSSLMGPFLRESGMCHHHRPTAPHRVYVCANRPRVRILTRPRRPR
jgi:hypothetical protein